ncbi:MAG: [NiFe]-hydrogenase assembly chaperone HybE [Bacteroidota bacterium]
MKIWTRNPAAELLTVFDHVARTRMAGLPICNPALQVETVDFRRGGEEHWVGALLTPWAIELLCLPGQAENWPQLAAGDRHEWHFPSGRQQFVVTEEAALGVYHVCSLYAPVLDFETQAQARRAALAGLHALFVEPPASPLRAMLPRRPLWSGSCA